MNLDKRKAVFNNQELSLMKVDGLKLIAERNMVKNIPLSYQTDNRDSALNEVGQSNLYTTTTYTQPHFAKSYNTVKSEVKVAQPQRVITTDTSLRQQLENLKLQNNNLLNNQHASHNQLQGLGNQFREVTMRHQNHILNLRDKNLYNKRDLDTVSNELDYFQFKNRQNFLSNSTLDRTLSHQMQNDMVDYQLRYLDNYNGAQGFTSNALVSQIESSQLHNTVIIPEKKIIRKQSQLQKKHFQQPQKLIKESQLVTEPVRERSFNTRKQQIANRYTDEIPIRIEKISKSKDRNSILAREYKHSDHVKVILAENDEIVEVPDTQRVDSRNIESLINESMIRKSSLLK